MKLRSLVGPAAVIGALAILVLIIALMPPSPAGLDDYLRAAAGAEADRGWHLLGRWTQAEFEGGHEQYVAEASAADWSGFRWSDPNVAVVDDGVAHVTVELDSEPSTVPAFLIERRIVHGVCGGGGGVGGYGLGAYTLVGPFSDRGLGAGGRTGSVMRCNAQFTGL